MRLHRPAVECQVVIEVNRGSSWARFAELSFQRLVVGTIGVREPFFAIVSHTPGGESWFCRS